ncbi:MAG: hypothetical protein WCJ58_07000 [bacterium]
MNHDYRCGGYPNHYSSTTYSEISALRADNYDPDLTLFPGTKEGLQQLKQFGLKPPWLLTGNPDIDGISRPSVLRQKVAPLLADNLVAISEDRKSGTKTKKSMLMAIQAEHQVSKSKDPVYNYFWGDQLIDFASWFEIGGPQLGFMFKTDPENILKLGSGKDKNGGYATSFIGINDPLMRLGFITPYLSQVFKKITNPKLEIFIDTLLDYEIPVFNVKAFQNTLLANVGELLLEHLTIPQIPEINQKKLEDTYRCLLVRYLSERIPENQQQYLKTRLGTYFYGDILKFSYTETI